MNINEQRVGGCLGADAIVRQAGEKTCLSFSIAVTKKRMAKGKTTERTEWFEVEFWPVSVEQQDFLLSNLKKGTTATAFGERRTKEYTDNEGVVRRPQILLAESVEPLGKIQLVSGKGSTVSSAPAEMPAPENVPPQAPQQVAQSPAPQPSPAVPVVPIDMTLAPGHYRASIRTEHETVQCVAVYDVLKPYISSGQVKLLAMGPPKLLEAKTLPVTPPSSNHQDHMRPPMPSEEAIAASGGFNDEEAPFG